MEVLAAAALAVLCAAIATLLQRMALPRDQGFPESRKRGGTGRK
jgi:hypothetical protein